MAEHSMKLRRELFEAIRLEQKTIEMRLYDEKRRQIAVGDTVTFRCEEEKLTVRVIALHCFPDFAALYGALPHSKLGSTDPKDMEAYYSVEEQQKYGVLGIEILREGNIPPSSVRKLTDAPPLLGKGG